MIERPPSRRRRDLFSGWSGPCRIRSSLLTVIALFLNRETLITTASFHFRRRTLNDFPTTSQRLRCESSHFEQRIYRGRILVINRTYTSSWLQDISLAASFSVQLIHSFLHISPYTNSLLRPDFIRCLAPPDCRCLNVCSRAYS